MNLAALIGVDAGSALITGVNVYIIRRHLKLRKERRVADRKAAADREDSHTGEDAGGSTAIASASSYISYLTSGASQVTGTGLEVVKQADPIRAWKTLALRGDDNTVFLASHYTAEALPLEGKASCHSNVYGAYGQPTHRSGAIPDENCSCGWYGLKEPPQGFVVAEVDFYGSVIEAEHGYRAEYQRILAVSIGRGFCQGGFLCDEPAELLRFALPETPQNWSVGTTASTPQLPMYRHPTRVCRRHADNDTVELGRVASRLGVEVRWA